MESVYSPVYPMVLEASHFLECSFSSYSRYLIASTGHQLQCYETVNNDLYGPKTRPLKEINEGRRQACELVATSEAQSFLSSTKAFLSLPQPP